MIGENAIARPHQTRRFRAGSINAVVRRAQGGRAEKSRTTSSAESRILAPPYPWLAELSEDCASIATVRSQSNHCRSMGYLPSTFEILAQSVVTVSILRPVQAPHRTSCDRVKRVSFRGHAGRLRRRSIALVDAFSGRSQRSRAVLDGSCAAILMYHLYVGKTFWTRTALC